MSDWDSVEVGKTIEVKLPGGRTTQGEVTEVGGRLLRNGTVDPGWARVRLEDGTELLVSEASLGDVLE